MIPIDGPRRTFASRVIAIVITIVVMAGCREESQRAVTVADSAGVEIITNPPVSIESAETWSLSAEPVVEIGAGTNPEVPLFRVTDVLPLESGRVAVGTDAPPRVVIFEPDGAVAATLGREGEGPGEFFSVGSVVFLPGDSLAVWDPDRRRVSVFTVDGRFARELNLRDIAPMSARGAPDDRTTSGFTHLMASASGWLILFGEGVLSSGPEPAVVRPELPAYRLSRDGEVLARFGPFPGMTTFVGGPPGALPLPLGARTHAATWDNNLVVGTAESTEFRVFAPTGALTRIVRWPERDRAVDGPFLSRWLEMVDARPEMRGLVEAVPRAERFPAYEGLVATGGGEILVGAYPGPLGIWPLRRADHGPEVLRPQIRIPARSWLVFDSAGAITATVRTPEGFEPYAVREGLVWGVYTDEVDVESVRAYRRTVG